MSEIAAVTFAALARLPAAWSPALSPDGRELAFVSDRDGAPRVWVKQLGSGSERVLDTGPALVQHVSWSVDGAWLAVLAAPGGSPRTGVWVVRPDGSDLHRAAAADGGATFLGPWTHRAGVLALACSATLHAPGYALLEDAASGARTALGEGGQPVVLDVSRDLRIALLRRGARGARTVWVVDIASGREAQLVPRGGLGSTDLGRLSPDGRFAYLRSNAGAEMYGLFEVVLDGQGMPLDTRLVIDRPDVELENVILTADGTHALLLWNFAGKSEAQLIELASGVLSDIELPCPVAHDGSFSADGKLLALTLEGPSGPRGIWTYDTTSSQWRQCAGSAPLDAERVVHPTLEALRSHDGTQITGWLYRAEPARAAPALLIHLHGGPEAQERPVWNPLFQALARHGISVFAPNIRGSSGFGRSFVTADDGRKRWDAIRDVVACAEYVLAHDLATPERLACGGRSYGGYLTLAMLVLHPELFAAGMDVCGMADLQTFYAHTEPFIAEAAYPKYGHPVHDAELLHMLSPIHRFDKLCVPLLVVHGANDSNVPVEESEQVVTRARGRGIDVSYLLFEGEGHELALPENRERFVSEAVEWLGRVLRV